MELDASPGHSIDAIFYGGYGAEMAKKYSELRARMSPEARARAAARGKALLKQMPLRELRRARGLSQETLAATLKVRQASISKLERRTDMYISTLRAHIEAMGGELEIIARFPEGEVRISNFGDVAAHREALAEYLAKEPPSAYEAGKDLFGRYGSGDGKLSTQRRERYAEIVNAKRRGRR